MTLASTTLLMTGVQLSGVQRFLLMLPLCVSIAVVYKATRCERLRDVPVAALVLWVTIALGMYAVGFGLWVAFQLAV